MCPVCLTTMGLYAAGGVSAGGITTYLATRWLRKASSQPECEEHGDEPQGHPQPRLHDPALQEDEGDAHPKAIGITSHLLLPPFGYPR